MAGPRETFEGRSTFRAWLYRTATNACLDRRDVVGWPAKDVADPLGAASPPSAP